MAIRHSPALRRSPEENPALQAVVMALEERNAIGALTETWRRWGHDIGFGIGIAHGFATLGTIGFEGRFDYAAIGTVSNVASRLCDEAKPGQILISPRVLKADFFGGGGRRGVPDIAFGCIPMPCSIGNSANILIARGKPASARKFFCVTARWLLWHSTRTARTVAVPAVDTPSPLTRGTMTCAAVDPAIQRRI